MADVPPVPPHARPALPLVERARRVELALAQEDTGEGRRRVVREALDAAVAQALREHEDERAFARFIEAEFRD